MKKLYIFTLYNEKGPSSRYRCYIFKELLEKNFKCEFSNFWSGRYVDKYMKNKKKYALIIFIEYCMNFLKRTYEVIFKASKADYVVFQKGVFPHLKLNYIKYLKKRNVKIIFDIDDAIYTYDRGASDIIATNVDLVFAGNNNLVEYYKSFNENTILIPTVDISYKYESFVKDTFNNKVIGWIGQKSTINNLDLVVEPLNKLIDRYPNVIFHIICDDDYGYCNKIKNSKFIKWHKDDFIHQLNELTVGIMPLYDTEMNRGKCGFKLVQYMNCKKPFCASAIGVNRDLIEYGGLSCNDENEWINNLQVLLFDKEKYCEFVYKIESEFFIDYGFEEVGNKIIYILNA